MANLIIKSSADNLVLQGSDASPAITVGATGTTTFAENATLSGSANVYGAGVLNSGVTGGSGLTIISPVWYPAHNADQHTTIAAGTSMMASRNLESYPAYVTGVIPAEYISLEDIQAYFYIGNSGSQTWTLTWNAASSDQTKSNDSLSATNIQTFTATAGKMHQMSVMSVGSAGSRFEDVVGADKMWGMSFRVTASLASYLLGVMITYKLKE